jgi:hypothetical protein
MGCKGNAFAAKGNTLADNLYGVGKWVGELPLAGWELPQRDRELMCLVWKTK